MTTITLWVCSCALALLIVAALERNYEQIKRQKSLRGGLLLFVYIKKSPSRYKPTRGVEDQGASTNKLF
ncbi:MAG: hypothetical protein ACFKPT_25375 [Gloeotrichia echinulata GP01]